MTDQDRGHGHPTEPEQPRRRTLMDLDAGQRIRLVNAMQAPTPVTRFTIGLIATIYIAFIVYNGRLEGQVRLDPGITNLLAANWRPLIVGDHQYWRLLTSVFMHANLIHIGLNSWVIWVLGQPVEKLLGSARLWILIVLAGLAGALASAVFNGNPSVGISGSAFGLLGAIIVIGRKFREYMPEEMARRLTNSMLPILALNLVLGFTVPGIDNAAHLGGLVGGGLVTALMASQLNEDRHQRLRAQGVAGLLAGLVVMVWAAAVLHVVTCGTSTEAMDQCYIPILLEHAPQELIEQLIRFE